VLQVQLDPAAPTLRLVTYINCMSLVSLSVLHSAPIRMYRKCASKASSGDEESSELLLPQDELPVGASHRAEVPFNLGE
jgi:hypothetical protein